MTVDCFREQIARLTDQWKHAYGKERGNVIWKIVKDMPDEFMIDTANYYLAYGKSAPLGAEFEKQIALFQQRKASYRSSGGEGSFVGLLQKAADKIPDVDEQRRDYARACVDLVRKKTLGQINARQFEEGCQIIDQVASVLKRPVDRGNNGR